MAIPHYRTITTTRHQPICSTNSLAVASLMLAASAILIGLSPLLNNAFLPLALTGLLLAVFSLFSYRDHSGLQVGALAVNGLVVLLALLHGPMAGPSEARASEVDAWNSYAYAPTSGSVIHGYVADRNFRQISPGVAWLGLMIQWDASDLSGCWNWIDGILVLEDATGENRLEVDWRISGPIVSGEPLTRGGGLDYKENERVHRWLATTDTENIVVTFMPTGWEHSALKEADGMLVPVPTAGPDSLPMVSGSH